MPYGQIIALMVAFVFVTGIPARETPLNDIGFFLVLWSFKTIAWVLFVALVANRVPGRRAVFAFQEKFSWLSLIPLLIDFYVLDIKSHLIKLPVLSSLPSLVDIFSIFFYLFYLTLVWVISWWIFRKRGLFPSSLRQNMHQRMIMILPALIPFFVATILESLLQQLHFPWLESFQQSFWYQAFYFFIFILFFLFFIPPFIRHLWKCTPLPPGRIKDLVNEALKKSKMKCRQILIWPLGQGEICTAAVLGLFPRFRYIMITPCLLENLAPEEVEAVIAHEVAHIRHGHMIWYLVFILIFAFGVFQLINPLWTWLLSQGFFLKALISMDKTNSSFLSFISVLPMSLLVIFYFRFVIGYFMRNFEREADLNAIPVQGTASYIISALEKVAFLAGGIRNSPSWHHYSVAERVDFLQEAGRDPGLIKKFKKNISKKRMLLVAIGLAACLLSQLLPVEAWEKRAKINLLKISMEELSQQEEQRPELYFQMGNLFYEEENYEKALAAYEMALKLSPENPEVINSIAWLYATAKVPDYRRPEDALKFAKKAARLDPRPHILDTLAESFFINGYIDKAVEIERNALSKNPQNKQYYIHQIERFENAMR